MCKPAGCRLRAGTSTGLHGTRSAAPVPGGTTGFAALRQLNRHAIRNMAQPAHGQVSPGQSLDRSTKHARSSLIKTPWLKRSKQGALQRKHRLLHSAGSKPVVGCRVAATATIFISALCSKSSSSYFWHVARGRGGRELAGADYTNLFTLQAALWQLAFASDQGACLH
jgi:hypothetical protein